MRFEGYAALFDRVDRGGDVIRPGAFADGAAPRLWQHRGTPLGAVAVAADTRGLKVSGEIVDPDIADMVGSGALAGLSIGFRATATRQGAWREILRGELVEVSLVAQPMMPGARVTQIFHEENETWTDR